MATMNAIQDLRRITPRERAELRVLLTRADRDVRSEIAAKVAEIEAAQRRIDELKERLGHITTSLSNVA